MANEIKQENKKFNTAYAVIAVIAFIAIAAGLITYYYVSHFIMFSPDKVARQYVMNTVEGDGYDALKYSTMSVNGKMGDYLRENYINKYVKENDGSAPELSAEEAGDKLTAILDKMYPVFVELDETVGFENYDEFFTAYFEKYAEAHKEIYGNDFISDEDMFTCIEGNLATYVDFNKVSCESTYGKGSQYALKFFESVSRSYGIETTPAEDEVYLAGYYIDTEVSEIEIVDDAEKVKAYVSALSESQKKAYESFGISTDDISAYANVKVVNTVSGEGDEAKISRANADYSANPTELTLIKIGSQWYVDIAA